MRKFWTLFKIEWQGYVEYRVDLLLYTLTGASFPILSLFIWLAIQSNILGFSNSELVIYFLLVLIVNILTSAWAAPFLAQEINNGEFSNYLLKPLPFLLISIVKNMVEKIYKLFIVIFFILIIIIFMKDLINFRIDLYANTLLLSVVSLILGMVIAFLLDIIVGLSAFWFQDIDFFRNTLNTISQFSSGKIIPIPLLPVSVLSFVIFLPFRYTLGFPIEILLGKVEGQNLQLGFLIQIVWVAILLIIYRWITSNGFKRYQGYGS